MEQNENVNPSNSLFQMNLDAQNSYNLRSAASWGKVLGVCGIILGALFCLLAFVALSKMGSDGYGYRRRGGGFDDIFDGSSETRTGLIIIILTGVIFILGGVFSFNFGNKISLALKSNDQQGLNNGFAALRNYYAVRSITLIILLLLIFISFMGRM